MTVDPANAPRIRRPGAFPRGRRLDPQVLDETREILGDAPRDRDLLLEHLHRLNDRVGYLTAAHLAALAHEMRLSQAEVYEVATFYHHFRVVPDGAEPPPEVVVRVCDGVACHMQGASALLAAVDKAEGRRVHVIPGPCMGACDRAPAVAVGPNQVVHADAGKVHEFLREAHIEPLLPDHDDSAAYAAWRRCLAGEWSRADVTASVEASGLRGLGGAGFPAARKWRFLHGAPKPRYLVVNADEGEPGTFKDRYCLEQTPHRVLEGALIAAWAIEAEAIYVYLRDEYPAARVILERAIARLREDGLDGGIAIHLRRGAGAYICGEESALLESLEGKRGLPRHKPPYPAQAGLFGRPTLINNVETLWWLPPILERGPDWFAGQGANGAKGLRLYSVSGRVRAPGVKEAPAGITTRALIDEHCGGMADGHEFTAFLPGGASGGILPARYADRPLDFGAFDDLGAFVGSAAVVILSQEDDPADIALNLMRFFEDESCGQCTPCRLGTEKAAELMKRGEWDAQLLGELARAMADASICGLGQAAPNPMLAVLRHFKPEESPE
jgi:formate dehydrogenase